MKRFRVQITTLEVFECWVEAEDWEAAEDAAMEEYYADRVDMVSNSETAEVVEEEDIECDE